MLGSPAGPGAQRGFWPATVPAPAPAAFTTDTFGKYGVYSLFPNAPTFGSTLYTHAASTFGRFASGPIQGAPNGIFHGTHKVSDSLFSTGYTLGAPTPPPGSPYSPIQLELLAKGLNSNIIIQPDYASNSIHSSPKKLTISEKLDDQHLNTNKCCQQNENNIPKCVCVRNKRTDSSCLGGCSRTNPIDWCSVSVKKELDHSELNSIVKLEVTSPTNKKHDGEIISTNSVLNSSNNLGSSIPVGIAVARQRYQHQEIIASPAFSHNGLLTTVNTARFSEIGHHHQQQHASCVDAGAAGMAAGLGGPTLLQCTDDRSASLANWPLGAASGGASLQATPTAALWQYPTAPAPMTMESMVPFGVPVPPVGFQLVRDPNTGGLLLLPTSTGLEHLQQAVVWPTYQQHNPVLLPPPPLQLLSSASSDYLSSSTTFQQTQTRLVAVTTTSDTKRKIPLPTTTLIKIEADPSTLDQSKAISTIANTQGTMYAAEPLVTTHVIYHNPPNLILSQPTAQPQEISCKSQGTSPVACLTPPPEAVQSLITMEPEEQILQAVPPPTTSVDASNQTESPNLSDEDSNTQSSTMEPILDEATEQNEVETSEKAEETAEIEAVPEPEVDPTPTQLPKTQKSPDLSGLELLSSAVAFEVETTQHHEEPQVVPEVEVSPEESLIAEESSAASLGGLDLLCALAEQRILEEKSSSDKNIEEPSSRERKKEKRRDRDRDKPRRKKLKKRQERDRNYKLNKLSIFQRSHDKKRSSSDGTEELGKKCACGAGDFKNYKSEKSHEVAIKFIESKTHTGCAKNDTEEEWHMEPKELDTRMKLADLQRQYREKKDELHKLKPKKHDCKRSRQKSFNSDRSVSPLPPVLDKVVLHNHSTPKELIKPPTLCPITPPKVDVVDVRISEKLKRKSEDYDRDSKNKKRKMVLPKKSEAGEFNKATETIVSKKPKSSFVNYLLAAKERLSRSSTESPPRYIDIDDFEDSPVRTLEQERSSAKIRPKLKAELTVKSQFDEAEHMSENESGTAKDQNENTLKNTQISTRIDAIINRPPSVPADVCTLQPKHLEMENMRVLTAMGGLFYAGQLHALEPPDVYSITLDGERGNRPHIMSREEVLRDAIVEVSPKSSSDLKVGTRLCAYWSKQNRCLYPGSVAEPGTPNREPSSKFVSVEFDDGDNGTISLDDIRLIPADFPIMEYDPNPLLSLSKRRRRTSSLEERRFSINSTETSVNTSFVQETEKENKNADNTSEKRKKLKKKKKNKAKDNDKEYKKKKKHKCLEDNCKHRKHHKKHRKHKKHHQDKEKDKANEIKENLKDLKEQKELQEEIAILDEKMEEAQDFIANPDDEVTMDDILEATDTKAKKLRDRQESCESSRSKMSAFLPARQLWTWSGKGCKKKVKGRTKREFFKTIQRGNELISVGDAAVFLSTGRPDRPYIGRIEAMWEQSNNQMIVRVKWFYHPEETEGCPLNLEYPGALFESPHVDENDVQTISHKCEVVKLSQYVEKLGNDPQRFATIYDNNDIYYLAGYYDPIATTLKMENDILFKDENASN